jgi:hypothetical protein
LKFSKLKKKWANGELGAKRVILGVETKENRDG